MRYAISRFEEERREFAYRVFVTDVLGHIIGLKERYYDMINRNEVEEKRTSEEIISNISAKLAKIGGE